MGKYQFSYEEKITIIREHEENHKTLKAICEEYDISKSYLCYILRDYRQNGKESLKNTKYYSAEYSQDTIPVKSVNPIFAHWCFLPLFVTIYAKGGESHEENHHPAAGASDERVFGGKAIGNLVKYANRANGNDCCRYAGNGSN